MRTWILSAAEWFCRKKSVHPNVKQISQTARLGMALRLFQGYCEKRGLRDDEINRFVDYLWDFVAIYGTDAFDGWVKREPMLVKVALGDPFPPDFQTTLKNASVPEAEFRMAIEFTAEILYVSMYGASNEEMSRRFLERLTEMVVPLGVAPPDVVRFRTSRWADEYGWGKTPSPEELADWRYGG